MRNRIDRILFIFVIVNIIDIITTYIILNNGGTELNPIVNYFTSNFGLVPGLLGFKGLVITSVVLLFRSRYLLSRYYRNMVVYLKLGTIIMAMVIGSFNITSIVIIWWLGSSAG